jgi:hypothetical protein
VSKESKQFRCSLNGGSANVRTPAEPIIEVVRCSRKRDTYLWIGNNVPDNRACFATLSGSKTLERLAREILAAITPRKPKRSKRGQG